MDDISAVERGDSLSQQVYDQLRLALIRGAYRPGEQLTIRMLAKQMNVSPTPAREALNRLAAEGALEFGANRSLWVPVLEEKRIRELYAIRAALEEQLVRAAFARLGDAQLQALEDCLAAREAALDEQRFRQALELNMEFSFIIFRAADLPITLRIIEGIWLLAGPTMNLFYPELAVDRLGIELHKQQLEAIRAGELERCLHYMRKEDAGVEVIVQKLAALALDGKTA
ncbi:GntR family transcriptional regulator [Comamonas composti]|uniref:GntR family transcriptional regulator n=1 Tax=Comamonas composti TaxID=408558 RepID=UPI000416C8A5|nr:GntR family transcriptional regulator [Comamonas composti]